MDSRIVGLVIVGIALFFLWLYDTGRWNAVSSAITGKPQATIAGTSATATGLQSVSLNPGGQTASVGSGSSSVFGDIFSAALGSFSDPIGGLLGSIL